MDIERDGRIAEEPVGVQCQGDARGLWTAGEPFQKQRGWRMGHDDSQSLPGGQETAAGYPESSADQHPSPWGCSL